MALSPVFVTLACFHGSAFAVADAGASGGDYQQYMDEYMGSGGGSSGVIDQYAKKYMGGASSSGNVQSYMNDYAGKYMSNNGGDGGNPSGNSQNFIKQYAKKYMGGTGGSQSYQQFVDKYAKGDMDRGQSRGSANTADSKTSASEKHRDHQDHRAPQKSKSAPEEHQRLSETTAAPEEDPSTCTSAKCICDWRKHRVAEGGPNDAVEQEYQSVLEKFAAKHSFTVADLGLAPKCQPVASAALLARPSAAVPRELLFLAGLSLSALMGLLGAPRFRRKPVEEETTRTCLLIA